MREILEMPEKAASVTSWFLKALRKESKAELAKQVRLRLVRFRRLLRQYGRMIALSADAAEKQSGEFILDKAYILTLSDKAFETIEGMIYDLNVLTGQQYLRFYDAVGAFREKTATLIKAGSHAPSSAPEEREEPEYRLLREMREMLFQTNSLAGPSNKQSFGSSLFDIAESAQEAAADCLAQLTRSLGSTHPPAAVHGIDLLPVRTSVVDLMNSLAGRKELLQIPDPLSIDSAPTREFLTAFFAPEIWKNGSRDPAAVKSASLVAVGLEDSMHATVFHQEGYDLLDAYLSGAPNSNYIYCRFASGSGFSAAAEILARLGFWVSKTRHGITGWLASQPPGEAVAKLAAIGKMAAFFLRPSPAGIQSVDAENNINRFNRMQD
jgi:hypothetical protein